MTTATAAKFFAKVGFSDLTPFEVVRVISDKVIEVREMQAEKGDWTPEYVSGGFACGCSNNHDQKWIISSNEAETIIKIRLQKSGKWQDANGNKYKMTQVPTKFVDHNF